MHPSRQALLRGNSSSYDDPPHLSSQNRNQGQQNYGGYNNFRRSSGSFGGGGGAMMGSSTNTIPLAGKSRWGGGSREGASPAKSSVSFEHNEQAGREQTHQDKGKQGGWGERSGGQVGLRGSRAEANGGDIWQTIPMEDESKGDQGWGTRSTSVSGQENSWGATATPAHHGVRSQPSGTVDGWRTPAQPTTTDSQFQSSGWDVPAPRIHPKPRSNTSSQQSQNFRQHQNQSSSPQHQQPHQYQQSSHVQGSMSDMQNPIRTESSGWYDYATPPPSFSRGSQNVDSRSAGLAQTSDVSGWGGERPNRAIQIKNPNEVSSATWGSTPPAQTTSDTSGGWGTAIQEQNQIAPASPIIMIQQQSGWDVPKPEESIQRWTREVGRSKIGEEEEVDGMDIEDTGGIGDESEQESAKVDNGWGERKFKVDQWRSGAMDAKVEETRVDDGWGSAAPAAASGWGGAEDIIEGQDPSESGWGQATTTSTSARNSSGWGQPAKTTTENLDKSGWGRAQSSNNNASPSNDDGWGKPRNTRKMLTTDQETAYPGRSPMDKRQPVTQAAKGMIQRHLQNPTKSSASMRSTSGEGPGRRSDGARNLSERPAPQSNPFDVAAGDIWSSLPALDDGEVIKPPSDSDSDSDSQKTDSSKASGMKDEKTRFRPDDDKPLNKEETERKIGRMSLASSDDAGSIHAHAVEQQSISKGIAAPPGLSAPPIKTERQPVSSLSSSITPSQAMLIDFDAPEGPYASMTSAPSSTLTYSSTLIDMDDMLDLKTPITSPDRKVIGLDQYHPTKNPSGGDFASLADGREFQNALDLGQLAKMFENGYPVSGRQQ